MIFRLNTIFSANSAKPAFIVVFGLILIVGLFMALALVIGPSTRASVTDNMVGYAWSSNIGWVSFNCTNTGTCGTSPYGVTIVSSMGMSDIAGYAWSSNIGWLDFSGSGSCSPSCPVGAGTSSVYAQINHATNQLSGWARFFANGGGWDGWVSLSGTGYGVTRSVCNLTGYAWGGDVVGWISFNGASYGVTITNSTFCEQFYGLTVSRSGTGSGTVTSVPAGINCGADCFESYSAGTPVSLSAVAAVGSRFDGFSGDIDCVDGSLTMDANKGCVATFTDITLSSISCSADPQNAFMGENVNWTVSVTGGQSPYGFNINWYWVSGLGCPVAGRTLIANQNFSQASNTYTTLDSSPYMQKGYVCMEATVTDVTGPISCTVPVGDSPPEVIQIFTIPDWHEISPEG